MGKIGLIIAREYWTRVRKPSFIIMSILGPLLIGAALTLIIWLSVGEEKELKVLVVDELGLTERLFRDKPGSTVFIYTRESVSKEEFINNDDFEMMLIINQNSLNGSKASLKYKKLPSLNVQAYITSELNEVLEGYRLMKAKNNPELTKFITEEYPKIKKHVELQAEDIFSDENAKFKKFQSIIGIAFAVIIYMFIFMYGVQVMRGVIEEKTNRIVEIIISSVRPFQLMMGKIIGIGLVGLTQFILMFLFTSLILFASQSLFFPDTYDPGTLAGNNTEIINVTGTEAGDEQMPQKPQSELYEIFFSDLVNWPKLFSLFLFYFITGYLMYAALFAAVGSAVDNEADTQQFLLPITIPLIFGFFVTELALNNPESNTVFWTSLIPLTAPVVMMVRIAVDLPTSELILSMFLMTGGFLFCTWLAAKIYRTGILMYGKKPSYKEIFKWLRYRG